MSKENRSDRNVGPARLLTVAEAAELLGVGRETLRRKIDAGELPHYRPSPRKVLVLYGDLIAYREAHTYRGRPPAGD